MAAKTEATPLKEPLAPAGKEESREFTTSKIAAPLAICFYICVAVVKTMLTYTLVQGSKTAVALSAVSSFVTCLMLVPLFLIKPTTWGVPDPRKNGPGLSLVVSLLSLDMGFANSAVQELTVPIQQCIAAVNPAVVVAMESVFFRKLKHPAIYMTVLFLVVGPVLNQLPAPPLIGEEKHHSSEGKNLQLGVILQMLAVLASACKLIFAHHVMRDCKKELGSAFAFLFWLDLLSLVILVPWSLINGEMKVLFETTEGGLEWFEVLANGALGGLRFFSQLLVLRYSTPTNLACSNVAFQAINIYLSLGLFQDQTITAWLIAGTTVTLTASGVYTYWKVSGVLTKVPACIKFDASFAACVTCNRGASAA